MNEPKVPFSDLFQEQSLLFFLFCCLPDVKTLLMPLKQQQGRRES